MEYFWNYVKERWIPDNQEFSMEAFSKQFGAEEDLTKIDVALEIFQNSEEEYLKLEASLEECQTSDEDKYLALKRAKLKQKLTSHFLVINLSHIIEKSLKYELTHSDCNAWSDNMDFKIIRERLKDNGINIDEFKSYKKICALRAVANSAKHDLEVDRHLSKLHDSLIFREELPYLGYFLKDLEILPATWDFIRELYSNTKRHES